MSKHNMNTILFNAAGIGILLTTVGYMGHSFLVTPKIAVCTSRYPGPMQFDFSGESGKPLSSIELQARAGVQSWGIRQNAKIVADAAGAPARALEVSLAKTDDEDNADQNGIGFNWPLGALSKASSSCLNYKVFIPENFKFLEPGYLPGIYGIGAEHAEQSDESGETKAPEGFQLRMGWGANGDIGTEIRAPGAGGSWITSPSTNLWPTGRWVDVAQEVILNAPEGQDAQVRVWVDGALIIEYGEFSLRGSGKTGLSGVLSEIGYARTASEAAKIMVSPFLISWQ